MNNYKIIVNNEAESKEAQDLFEQLGFTWAGDHPENGDWYSHLYAEKSSCCHLPIYVWNGLGDKFQEITLPQLRDLVAKSKNEQGLISGADALRALADGKEVERKLGIGWCNDVKKMSAETILHGVSELRIKPRTVKIELEIPAPFEPKEGDMYWHISPEYMIGYATSMYNDGNVDTWQQFGAWRTEEEIKQVVAALRGIKG